jgi:hypothetical protein
MPFKKGETPKGAKPFTSEHQPENRGRPPGSKSRSTVLKKWLTAEIDIKNPLTKLKQRGTVEDEVVLALITKARQGDVPAIKEVLDTMYGKLTDKVQLDVNQLDADIERELALLGTGSEGTATAETESEAVN